MNQSNSTRSRFSFRLVLEVLLLLWAGVVLYNFLTLLPPFRMVPGQFLKAWVEGRILWFPSWRIVGQALQSLCFFALAALPGWFFCRRRLPGLQRWMVPVISICIGWGLWMLLVEIFAIFYLFYGWALLFCWLVICVACWFLPQKPIEQREKLPRWKQQHPLEQIAWWLGLVLVGLITFWTFYQALVFPVVYWDSLILYVDYAQQTYLQHGFPTLVCAQVGLGLGANYPHFYPLTNASMSLLWGGWQNAHAQFISPFAALLACLMLYHLVLGMTRKPLVAMLTLLVFRSFPYATFYFIYASDYSVVMLLPALCLWGAWWSIEKGRAGGLEVVALAIAFALHVNYMMGLLGIVLLAAPVLRAWRNGQSLKPRSLYPKPVLILILITAVLGSGWFIRNIIVTGNPVYAFFPKLFGGKNINMEVLESCFQEWHRHGDGIGRFGSTLGAKIRGLPRFLFLDHNFHWKYGPMLTAIALPGLVFIWRKKQPVLILAFLLFAAVTAYHFLLGDLYLYHTLMMVPALAILGAGLLVHIRNRVVYGCFVVWMLVAGVYCGLCPAIVGGKRMSFRPLMVELPAISRATDQWMGDNQSGDWQEKFQERFKYLALGDSYLMWKFMNANIGPASVLTHENRHLYLDRDIELVGLDDCGLTPFYDEPFEKVAAELRRRNILYYLRVDKEAHHPITARLGVTENLDAYYNLIHEEGNERLYRLKE